MFDIRKTGQYIAFLRKNKNMTQGQLADILGVSHQAVSNWERGGAMPDISLLVDLAQALDTSTDSILMVGNNYAEDKNESKTVNISQSEEPEVNEVIKKNLNTYINAYIREYLKEYINSIIKNQLNEMLIEYLKENFNEFPSKNNN